MFKTYKFNSHAFELPIERKEKVKCNVWESSKDNPSVIVLEYDFGDDLNDSELHRIANHIVSEYGISVISIEYAETTVKFSEDLLSKLESYLPDHLTKISNFLSTRHQKLIEGGAFQEVINDLYYNAYVRYPINEATILPLYGNENTYSDFGVASALDILSGLHLLKEIYPNWKWNDCIGFGTGYGAYILEMAEKFSPNTFSMLINNQGPVKPLEQDLFTNQTELENGDKKNVYIKYIGKFPLYLNELHGWTTNKNHPFYFEQRHFDIRNLNNMYHLEMCNRKTPLIFIEVETNEKSHLTNKLNYVDNLIFNDFPIEYFLAEETDVDNKMVFSKNSILTIDKISLLDYYINKDYKRNLEPIIKDYNLFPVTNGIYLTYNLLSTPKIEFIPSSGEDGIYFNELEYLKDISNKNKDLLKILTNDEIVNNIIYYLKNPILQENEEYLNLVTKDE